MAKYRYKFSTKKHSIGGVISTIMFVGALALFIWAIAVSFENKGKGGEVVGQIALSSFGVSIFLRSKYGIGHIKYRAKKSARSSSPSSLSPNT